jgi:hypothetical protein
LIQIKEHQFLDGYSFIERAGMESTSAHQKIGGMYGGKGISKIRMDE